MTFERSSDCLAAVRPGEHSTAAEVAVINPLTDSRWDLWVQAHPHSTFFHTSAWAQVLTETYGHRPFYLRISRSGESEALLPLMEVRSFLTGRRGVSLPFSDSSSPLLFNATAASALTRELNTLADQRQWKHIELRGTLEPDASRIPSVRYLGHSLDLSQGPESLFAQFESRVRGAIRKGERSGVTAAISTRREALLEFYRLHQKTRQRHGVPPQPLAFFLNIHEYIIKRGMGFVVLASRGSLPIAGAVYFRFGDKAIYKFGASDETQHHVRGNNVVMWKAIKFLSEAGVKTLHFGRTSFSNQGLREFKVSWGGTEEVLAYYRFNTKTHDWVSCPDRASGVHNQLFSRLPVSINRLAGALIYPHLD